MKINLENLGSTAPEASPTGFAWYVVAVDYNSARS